MEFTTDAGYRFSSFQEQWSSLWGIPMLPLTYYTVMARRAHDEANCFWEAHFRTFVGRAQWDRPMSSCSTCPSGYGSKWYICHDARSNPLLPPKKTDGAQCGDISHMGLRQALPDSRSCSLSPGKVWESIGILDFINCKTSFELCCCLLVSVPNQLAFFSAAKYFFGKFRRIAHFSQVLNWWFLFRFQLLPQIIFNLHGSLQDRMLSQSNGRTTLSFLKCLIYKQLIPAFFSALKLVSFVWHLKSFVTWKMSTL